MNTVTFRKHLIRNKSFLKQLVNAQQVTLSLKHATVTQLDLLLRLLHELAAGQIPLSPQAFRILSRNNKLESIFHYFGTREDLAAKIAATKPSKVHLLKQYKNQFSALLYRLFNEPDFTTSNFKSLDHSGAALAQKKSDSDHGEEEQRQEDGEESSAEES